MSALWPEQNRRLAAVQARADLLATRLPGMTLEQARDEVARDDELTLRVLAPDAIATTEGQSVGSTSCCSVG